MSTSDLFDTGSIPDDAAYWDALARRVAAHASREPRWSGFEWLAQSRASWAAACVLLAAALVLMALPRDDAPVVHLGDAADWARALAPADDVGRATVAGAAPPAIGTLLLREPGR